MSGFSESWLELREPVDHRSRDFGLIRALGAHLEALDGDARVLLDLGCGTGSTCRGLSPVMPDGVEWRLFDKDPALLEAARRRLGPEGPRGARHQFLLGDAGGETPLPLDGVAVVTSSAFFDLCSAGFCARLVRELGQAGAGLYANLTYDGKMSWSIPHELDTAVVRDFNLHQRRDKGFGPALGPQAAPFLSECLKAVGYRVESASSPWRMGPQDKALQIQFLEGMRRPLEEIGTLPRTHVSAWIGFRLGVLDLAESTCEVGHTDLLALGGASA